MNKSKLASILLRSISEVTGRIRYFTDWKDFPEPHNEQPSLRVYVQDDQEAWVDIASGNYTDARNLPSIVWRQEELRRLGIKP